MSKLDRSRSQLEHLVFKFQIEVSTDFFDEIFLNSFLHSIHCEIKKRMHLTVITLSSLGNQCDVTRIHGHLRKQRISSLSVRFQTKFLLSRFKMANNVISSTSQ